MASKLRQGRDIEIPGVGAAKSLQEAIREVRDLRTRRNYPARPEGTFTVKEYAAEAGISESTAKTTHLYPLLAKGLLEVFKMNGPIGGRVHYYRKKTDKIESNRKETYPASNGHALDIDKGRRK